jgi:hypothetical protein
MSDEQNKAIDQHIAVPPAVLEAVAADPAAAQPIHRAQAMKLSHELFVNRRSMSIPQQMQLMETLAKLGNLAPKTTVDPNQQGSGISINIVLPGHKEKSVTVESVQTIEQTTDE